MRSAPNSVAVLREHGMQMSVIALDLDISTQQLLKIARGNVTASIEITTQLDRMASAVAEPRMLPERHAPNVTLRYGR